MDDTPPRWHDRFKITNERSFCSVRLRKSAKKDYLESENMVIDQITPRNVIRLFG